MMEPTDQFTENVDAWLDSIGTAPWLFPVSVISFVIVWFYFRVSLSFRRRK